MAPTANRGPAANVIASMTEKRARRKLVKNAPIMAVDTRAFTKKVTALLDRFSSKVEKRDIAKRVYFQENTFRFYQNSFATFTFANREEAELLRTITVINDGNNFSGFGTALKRCPNLQTLEICVSEISIIEHQLFLVEGYLQTPRGLRPQDYSPQMNLTVLRAKGMDALRALRIPNVLFSTDPEDEGGDGPIPGGILETIVAQEMMGKKDDLASTKTSRKRKLTEDAEPPKKRARTTGNADTKSALTTSGKPFPLLKLSAELRNSIYEYAMTIDGPINPSKRHPTSHHRSDPPRSSKNKFRPGPAPESALALLLVNKQVKNEALGIYYSNNQLEFHSPQQLETFLQSISDERKECIRKLKLYTKLSDDHSLEEQLLSANNLKNLEHFELGLVSYKSGEKNLMAHSRWASEQEWLRKLGGRGVKVKLWSFSIDGDEGNP